MKLLTLQKRFIKVKSTELREGLHQIIDRIEDDKILEAAYTLLEQQDVVLYTTCGNALTQRGFEVKISEGEQDIKQGKVHSHYQVKEHFRNKLA